MTSDETLPCEIEWRITADSAAAINCVHTVEADGEIVERLTEIRAFGDGTFGIGELSKVAITTDGQHVATMRHVENVRIKWRHKVPCRWCMGFRDDAVKRMPQRRAN